MHHSRNFCKRFLPILKTKKTERGFSLRTKYRDSTSKFKSGHGLMRRLSHCTQLKSNKQNETESSLTPSCTNSAFDTKLDGIIVQKALIVNKTNPESTDAWNDIQNYLKLQETETNKQLSNVTNENTSTDTLKNGIEPTKLFKSISLETEKNNDAQPNVEEGIPNKQQILLKTEHDNEQLLNNELQPSSSIEKEDKNVQNIVIYELEDALPESTITSDVTDVNSKFNENSVIHDSHSTVPIFGKILGVNSLLETCLKLNMIKPFMTKDNIQIRQLTTSAAKLAEDGCLPPPLPPKSLPPCEINPKNLEKYCKIRKQPEWEGCDKICMPCCCPAVVPPACNELGVKLNTCKRIEYRIPAFSECKKDPLIKLCSKECCYQKFHCPVSSIDRGVEPLIRTRIRQEWLLGRKTNMDHHKTFSSIAARSFSTMTPLLQKEKKDCKKLGGMLPCLKASELLSGKKEKASNRKECEKLCMPCCAPARDPPDCYYPYVKPECKKMRPPRPSYSECKKDALKSPKPCECLIPRLPPCDKGASSNSQGCRK